MADDSLTRRNSFIDFVLGCPGFISWRGSSGNNVLHLLLNDHNFRYILTRYADCPLMNVRNEHTGFTPPQKLFNTAYTRATQSAPSSLVVENLRFMLDKAGPNILSSPDIVDSWGKTAVRKMMMEYFKDNPDHLEKYIVGRNGLILHMLVSSAEQRDDNGGAALILSKITDMWELYRTINPNHLSMWYLKANSEQRQTIRVMYPDHEASFDTLDMVDEEAVEDSDLLEALERISK